MSAIIRFKIAHNYIYMTYIHVIPSPRASVQPNQQIYIIYIYMRWCVCIYIYIDRYVYIFYSHTASSSLSYIGNIYIYKSTSPSAILNIYKINFIILNSLIYTNGWGGGPPSIVASAEATG